MYYSTSVLSCSGGPLLGTHYAKNKIAQKVTQTYRVLSVDFLQLAYPNYREGDSALVIGGVVYILIMFELKNKYYRISGRIHKLSGRIPDRVGIFGRYFRPSREPSVSRETF